MEPCREHTCVCPRPTAAAIAYGLDKKGSGERNVLIYVAWLSHDETLRASSEFRQPCVW